MVLPPHLDFWCNGCLVPNMAVEDTAGFFLVCAAPLFEEEGNVRATITKYAVGGGIARGKFVAGRSWPVKRGPG